jgi:hypothetical protein
VSKRYIIPLSFFVKPVHNLGDIKGLFLSIKKINIKIKIKQNLPLPDKKTYDVINVKLLSKVSLFQ